MKYLLFPFLLLVTSYGMLLKPHSELRNSARIKKTIDLKNGEISNFSYDSVGRLLTISVQGSKRSTSYHYGRNYVISQQSDSLGYIFFTDTLLLNVKGLAISAAFKSIKPSQVVNIVNGVPTTKLKYDTVSVAQNFSYDDEGRMIRCEEFNDCTIAHITRYFYENQNLVNTVDSSYRKSNLPANKKAFDDKSFMYTQEQHFTRDTNRALTSGYGSRGIKYFGRDSQNPIISTVTINNHKSYFEKPDTTSEYIRTQYNNDGRAITKVSYKKFNQRTPTLTDSISIVYY